MWWTLARASESDKQITCKKEEREKFHKSIKHLSLCEIRDKNKQTKTGSTASKRCTLHWTATTENYVKKCFLYHCNDAQISLSPSAVSSEFLNSFFSI